LRRLTAALLERLLDELPVAIDGQRLCQGRADCSLTCLLWDSFNPSDGLSHDSTGLDQQWQILIRRIRDQLALPALAGTGPERAA